MPTRNSNIGTGNYEDPALLKQRGYNLVRLVSIQNRPDGTPLNDYVQALWDQRIAVMAVVSPQSNGFLCWADIYQISASGVEPDTDGTTPQQQVDFWNSYYGTYFAPGQPLSQTPIIGPGLASGLTTWWQQVLNLGGLPGAVGYDVHPYGKTASQAQALFSQYGKVTPSRYKRYCMEWARPAAEIPEFVEMLEQNTVLSAWFCEDCLVPGFTAPPRIFFACAS